MTRTAYLSIPDAAAKCGVGESTLRRLAASGELRGAIKVGRDWIIPATTIDRLTPRAVGRPAKR
ncbi:MAG TPA: helix-turn-helix domain-containing protein [Candidatus Dormibacteraeota bacterium]|nr:helix-turn-helix domain-containing protein [Candidatus Dormibacteraeota bacterium]